MEDYLGSYYIVNGRLEPAGKLESLTLETVDAVYDVIRISGGVPLFFEDHYLRLQDSLRRMDSDLIMEDEALRYLMQKLVRKNGLTECNIKTTIYNELRKQNVILYASKSYYPPEEVYKQGVHVSLFCAERKNPNLKLLNLNYKDLMTRTIKERDVFELLLVNGDNRITEGSKSNVFFVKGNKVFTTPDSFILKGVTRKYVLEAIENAGYEVIEVLVDTEMLGEMDGVFISGTSIKVLPVYSIDGQRFDSPSNPVILDIRSAFDAIVSEYIISHNK